MHAIYKICTASEWVEAMRVGEFAGSEVDRRDGFIHFSTRDQIPETAAKHFARLTGLVLVMVDANRFDSSLRWEPSRGGALFPHLYASFDTSAAILVKELPEGEARAAYLESLPDR
jgi:uncharacterized protein (DUF952 family)